MYERPITFFNANLTHGLCAHVVGIWPKNVVIDGKIFGVVDTPVACVVGILTMHVAINVKILGAVDDQAIPAATLNADSIVVDVIIGPLVDVLRALGELNVSVFLVLLA